MPSEKMISKKENGVGWMILNNPERHNAISLEMWSAAMEAMQDFRADKSVRVVVVTGAGGKAFASGADISKFKDERQEAAAVAHYQETTQKAYACKYGIAFVLGGNRADQFHDDHSLAGTCAAKNAGLATLGEGSDQVNDFETGVKDVHPCGLL